MLFLLYFCCSTWNGLAALLCYNIIFIVSLLQHMEWTSSTTLPVPYTEQCWCNVGPWFVTLVEHHTVNTIHRPSVGSMLDHDLQRLSNINP